MPDYWDLSPFMWWIIYIKAREGRDLPGSLSSYACLAPVNKAFTIAWQMVISLLFLDVNDLLPSWISGLWYAWFSCSLFSPLFSQTIIFRFSLFSPSHLNCLYPWLVPSPTPYIVMYFLSFRVKISYHIFYNCHFSFFPLHLKNIQSTGTALRRSLYSNGLWTVGCHCCSDQA